MMATAEVHPLAATREAVGPTLIRLQKEGNNLLVVHADMGKYTSARKFPDEFP